MTEGRREVIMQFLLDIQARLKGPAMRGVKEHLDCAECSETDADLRVNLTCAAEEADRRGRAALAKMIRRHMP